MNPLYNFILSVGSDTRGVYPTYKDDLALDFSKESGQEFFRRKMTGKLTFSGPDFAYIAAQAFDAKFELMITISLNGGSTWATYWKGVFWKTDCEFDEDAQTISVTPEVSDRYNAILAGLEKEYDLIQLAPAIKSLWLKKRPLVQVYVPGESVLGCFLGNMWWEQDCEIVTNESNLINRYFFAKTKTKRVVEIESIGAVFVGDVPTYPTPNTLFSYELSGTDGMVYRYTHIPQSSGGSSRISINKWEILSDGIVVYSDSETYSGLVFEDDVPTTRILDGYGGGQVSAYIHDISIFARLLTNLVSVGGTQSSALHNDDMAGANPNYSRAVGYNFSDNFTFYAGFSNTPTKWGLYQPGQYYAEPYVPGVNYYPIARRSWGMVSFWYGPELVDQIAEAAWREDASLPDAYPLASVISVLLGQVAPDIDFSESSTYSEFLYDALNPISGIFQQLLITPKSNVKSIGYDQPAQRAPITLKAVFDMLRDCFRCYWWVDDDDHLRIEHISYFMKGGSYSGTPALGIDLTTETLSRNGKNWAFARNQYKFDKPDMPARYQFGWMDGGSEPFDGMPIEIVSGFVQKDRIEEVRLTQFSADVDYIMLEPGQISSDGFVLLAAKRKTSALAGLTASTTSGGDRFLSPDMPIPQSEWGRQVQIKVRAKGTADGTLNAIIAGTGVDDYPGIYITLQGPSTWVEQIAVITIPVGEADDMVLQWYFNTGVSFGDVQLEVVAASVADEFELPILSLTMGEREYIVQNAYAAFAFLQQYYLYDMPAPNIVLNGEAGTALGVKRLRSQSIRFPVLADPDTIQAIRTGLGDGIIEKLSINLQSRIATATLRYDTE